MGSFGKAAIKEFAVDNYYGDGCVLFRDDYGTEDKLVEGIAEGKYNGTEDGYKKAEQEAKTLWKKAIVFYIEMPEE